MKDRVDAVFGKDELPIPKPLFGFTLRGAHEKTEVQLRHMIATDRRIQFPLDDFETSLYNAVQVHCAITGKNSQEIYKRAMEGYRLLYDESAGRMNLVIERIESGHPDIAAWDAKWIGVPPMVLSGKDNDKMVPIAPARICLVANTNQYDTDLREAFENVIGSGWEEIAYANPFYIVARTVTVEGDESVHYPVSILNDVMAVALNLAPLYKMWE